MKPTNMKQYYAVVCTYSFSADVSVRLFDTVNEAESYMVNDFNAEKSYQEENLGTPVQNAFCDLYEAELTPSDTYGTIFWKIVKTDKEES